MNLNLTKPLAFFDLETTGINVGSDRIVEISIVRVNIDNTTDILTKKVNPTIPIPEFTWFFALFDFAAKLPRGFSSLSRTDAIAVTD